MMDISHPQSLNFGKHWSAKQVADTFAPSKHTQDSVKEWLASAGIPLSRISKSQSMGWLNFDLTVAEAEKLLRTDYYIHEHGDSKTVQVAFDDYSVPETIREHVDFITPTLHFDAKIGSSGSDFRKRGTSKRANKPTVDAGNARRSESISRLR